MEKYDSKTVIKPCNINTSSLVQYILRYCEIVKLRYLIIIVLLGMFMNIVFKSLTT